MFSSITLIISQLFVILEITKFGQLNYMEENEMKNVGGLLHHFNLMSSLSKKYF